MWVRDALPRYLPNVRAILYGYDTTLVDSRSFQSIGEISGTLRDRLIPMAYSTAHSRPIIFLAHSLGGIVLKKTLVMLADSGPEGIRLLNLIYGGSEQLFSYLAHVSLAKLSDEILFFFTRNVRVCLAYLYCTTSSSYISTNSKLPSSIRCSQSRNGSGSADDRSSGTNKPGTRQ